MEFTFKVSEAEYLRAWKLRRGPRRWPLHGMTILFWLFICVCLVLIWAVVERGAQTRQNQIEAPAHTVQDSGADTKGNQGPVRSTGIVQPLLVNEGPFALILCLYIFLDPDRHDDVPLDQSKRPCDARRIHRECLGAVDLYPKHGRDFFHICLERLRAMARREEPDRSDLSLGCVHDAEYCRPFRLPAR